MSNNKDYQKPENQTPAGGSNPKKKTTKCLQVVDIDFICTCSTCMPSSEYVTIGGKKFPKT